MTAEIDLKYTEFYRRRAPENVYPVEFVVRAFLGSYPRLKTDSAELAGARVLDVGFGDGRNMPLLHNLGMQVHGVEISAEICNRARTLMDKMGVAAELRVGRNTHIPYDDAFFDHVVACHSCYYIDAGSSFSENLREVARVMRPRGLFVFSVPIGSSYIMRGARDLGGGAMEIAEDPYGVRRGYVLQKFDTEADLSEALAPWFGDLRIGSCRNDFWGIEEHVWIVAGRRRLGDVLERASYAQPRPQDDPT